MLHPDCRGLPVTAADAMAVRHLDSAIQSILGHRADVADHLKAALATDPDLVAAHALHGLLICLLARGELMAAAAGSLASARRALAARGGTARERGLVTALAAWVERGEMETAAGVLETILADAPCDAAALKVAHGIRFMLGDAAGMRQAMERALPAWAEETPGFGFVLGCHAFSLEETGATAAAERTGRRAVALESADLWGAHAVAHVLETEGRAREGITWLAATEEKARDAVGFGRHLFWHRALCHLHLGEGEAALTLYDRGVWDTPSEEFRDVANAASLLWRMEAQGVAVGSARWDVLADIAERRIGDHALAFADLHHVLSLAAAGRAEALAAFLDGMQQRSHDGPETQARVLARVGLPAARAVAAALTGDAAGAADLLARLRAELGRLGGSHAQRDLLERIALESAAMAGRDGELMAMLRERAGRRALGRWEMGLAARLSRSSAAPQPALEADGRGAKDARLAGVGMAQIQQKVAAFLHDDRGLLQHNAAAAP